MKKKIEEIKEAIYNCGDEYAENREQVIRAVSLLEALEKQFSLNVVGCSLPTKEEVISEGEKQIIDWLEGNTEREKKHYRIGFRRSFEYVLRRLK